MNKDRDEYYVLTEKLEEITWALEGKCNDIDCDRYMYKDILKKKYKPVLKHGYSCIPKLNIEENALMRLLSLNKFRKFRYKQCSVCNKKIDSLGNEFTIVSFTRPIVFKGRKVYEYKGYYAHKKCKSKVNAPNGWKKGF